MDVLSQIDIWEVAGPIIIMGITVLVIGVIGLIILAMMPKGLLKEVIRILLIVAVVAGAIILVMIASGVWAIK